MEFYVDFAKAFDKVFRLLLVKQLQACGIRENELTGIKSWADVATKPLDGVSSRFFQGINFDKASHVMLAKILQLWGNKLSMEQKLGIEDYIPAG